MSLLAEQEKHDIRRNAEQSADPVLEAIDLTIAAVIKRLATVSVEPVMKLADDYAELEAQRSYMADQGTRNEMAYDYPALQSDTVDARIALEKAITTQLSATRVQAIEEAARVCDTHTVDDVLVGVGISKSCASMIRALIGGPT